MAKRKLVALALSGSVIVFLVLWITPVSEKAKFTGMIVESGYSTGHYTDFFLSTDGVRHMEYDIQGSGVPGVEYEVKTKLNIFGYPIRDLAEKSYSDFYWKTLCKYFPVCFNATPNSTNWFNGWDTNWDGCIDILDAIRIAK